MTTAAKQRCREELAARAAQFRKDGRVAPVLDARTCLVDEVVREAWQRSMAPVAGAGVSLLAVGGYGRKELFPHSDVDLLLLVKRPFEGGEKKAALSEFLRQVWDSGLRASHSVRTLDECVTVHEGNYELTVSLLDERHLAGDAALEEALQSRLREFVAGERRDLVRRMCRMARARHARYHDTIFRLEPDVKETPGGMRDVQTIHWLALLSEDAARDPREDGDVDFLGMTRCFLHFRAGRDQNVLSFEAQDEIASAEFSPWRDPAEWMREYYRHASKVFDAALADLEAAEARDRNLLSNFRDWRSRLSNSEFTVSRELVFLRNPRELDVDARLAQRLFVFVARHGLGLARETEQRLVDHVLKWTAEFASRPPQSEFWRELLSQPHASVALRAMRRTGFLAALTPEWARIDHLVVRDFYHQYTVDEHTTVAIEVLEELNQQPTPEKKAYADLMEESEDLLWLLRLALLLHDIGKGSGRDHSAEAVRLGRVVLERMSAGELESELVLFLIDKHLLLPSALQSKDTADPATAAALAAEVKTAERLRLLTLLSYADISAVNPTAMTAWRMEQLMGLYRSVYRYLTGELTARSGEDPRAAFGELGPETAEFLSGLPRRYMWTHTAKEAASHAALFRKALESGAEVSIERGNGAWRATLVAADRPFLFASIAGTLSSFGLDILKADAFSNSHHYVADGFMFHDPNRSLDLNPSEQERLREMLKKVARGQVRVEDLLKNRPVKSAPSRSGAVRPSVSVDLESSPSAAVFEVVAQDRPGLLYHLASAISRAECNIEVVLVDTEAHKALDVFHVTRRGLKPAPDEAAALRQALEAACL